MRLPIIRLFWTVFVTACWLSFVCGCKDQRIDNTPPQKREAKIDAPGASVTVDSDRSGVAAPRAGNEVEVDVGPGGVQVGVDVPAPGERLRERREDRQTDTPR
jgi:hypothetical protein